MHVNPTYNQTCRCLWRLGLVNNNRKTMFTEPSVLRDATLSDQGPASHWPPLPESGPLFDPREDFHHRTGHQAPSSAGFSHRAHQRRSPREERWPLHIWEGHPPCGGWQHLSRDQGSGLGSLLRSAPSAWLRYFLPALQATAGPRHSSLPWIPPHHLSIPLLGVDKTWPMSQTEPKASFC